MNKSVRPASIWRVLPLLALVWSGACDDSDRSPAAAIGSPSEAWSATLELEWEIGRDLSAPAEYQFASIESLLPVENGRFWVLDGGSTPRLRVYDSDGRYVRNVGAMGMGPGEYMTPIGLALLPDGRIALRDLRPNRVTLYRQDGSLSETVQLPSPLRWPRGGGYPIQADTAGVLWLPFASGARPGPGRSPAFLRLRPDGAIVDTISFPRLPDVDGGSLQVERRQASGNVARIGIPLPYQVGAAWSWTPSGRFAVARTDVYRVTLVANEDAAPSSSAGRSSPEAQTVIERNEPPIPVPDGERRVLRRSLEERLAGMQLRDRVSIPELPRSKPVLKGLSYGMDGSILVFRSAPSELVDGEWVEGTVLDVFGADGAYSGSVALPHELGGLRFTGDHILAVTRGPLDIQVVRRYRLRRAASR